MKKFLFCIMLLVLTLSIASCGGGVSCQHRDADDNSLCDKCGDSYTDGNDSPDHTHEYNQQSTDSKYLAAAADCENAAKYYYSCECGAKSTATFVSGDPLGHRDANDNNLCDNCNKPYMGETDIIVPAESISFDNATASIEVGDTITLITNFSPTNTTDKTLTWISSDTSIAMVTNGIILGIKPGSTTIIAMTANGKTATCLVNVLPKTYYAESISLDKTELEIAIGYSYTLSATVLPDYTTDKSLTWSSSNSSIVKVENGKVTAVSAGTATITATASNGKSASCTVTSLFIPVTDVVINKQIVYVDAGKSETINTTTVPDNATVSTLIWSSSDTNIATVKDGVVTGVADGIAVISVSTADGSITKKFNVIVENSAEIVYSSYGSGYSVTALNKITETVIIPDTYKGKPVTSISSGVFGTECYAIKKLYIGKNITSLPGGILKNCTKLETLSIQSAEYDYIGDLFGTVSIQYTGTTDDFVPDDTQAGMLSGVGSAPIYQIPASGTDWILYTDSDWFYVDGVAVYVYDSYISHTNVVTWQYYTNGYEGWNVPKKVKLTAYYIPISLVNIYNGDTNAITLEASSACVDKVKDLKVTFNGVSKPLAELISLSDLEKIKVAGTYDLTVYFDGYIGTVSVTVTGHTAASAVQENYADSSCTQTGSYDSVCYCYSCKTELSREKETIAAKGHTSSSAVKENNIEPKCTQTGSYDSVVYCSVCNSELSRKTITVNAKGHDYVNHEAKAVTCLNIGWDAYQTCSRCDYTSYKTIEALGHDCVNHAAKDATCTAIGWYEYDTCSRCSYSTYVEIAKLGHDYIHNDAKAKTCTDIGWKAYETCSRCDYTTYVEIPASHNPKAAVEENRAESKCNEEGSYQSVVYCADCKKELSRTNNEITRSHKMSDGHCTVCGLPQSSSGLKFTLNNDGKGYTLTGIGNCKSTNIIIGVYNNLSVTSIGADAFHGCTSLTSVTIPDSVTSIGDSAFSGCTSLTSITIPNSVTSIGWSAFAHCTGLTSVAIGNSVTSIGTWAFGYCESLTSIIIPDSVTSIGYYAFRYCTSLKILCEATSKPRGWDSDWNYSECPVVWGCTDFGISEDGLLWASTSSDLYIIGYRGTNTELIIPETINGKSVTQISSYAFKDCTSLTSVTIPNSVTSIGERAFFYCTSLTSVTIPYSVTSIGDGAFYYCTSLTSVNYLGTIEQWCNISFGNIFSNPLYYANNLYLNGELATEIVIPNGVKTIPTNAFSCKNITSVTIPDSVTSIGYCAFYGCTGLTSIIIPDSVTSIGTGAFYYCTSLTSIIIPDSVTSIGAEAFYGCTSLTSIVFKDTSTWYITTYLDYWEKKTGGTSTSVINASTNAQYFKSDYCDYYWYKK